MRIGKSETNLVYRSNSEEVHRKIVLLPSTKKLAVFAITALAIQAISNTVGVDAGPVTGMIGYWLTKTLCYGAAAGAATAAVISGAGAVVGGMAATAGASAIGMSTGVSVVAAGVAGSATATVAATEATAAIVGGVGIPAAVAAVETASLTVGAFLSAIPFLP